MKICVHFDNGHGLVNLYRGNDEYIIADLYVQPSDRKRGYGTELLHSAISEFRYENLFARGQLKLVICAPRDSWMEKWFEREGFQRRCDDAEDGKYVWMFFKEKKSL